MQLQNSPFEIPEYLFSAKISEITSSEDPAHDFLHFQRVVNTAKKLAHQEKAQMEVVVPAAWLHDFVIVPKSSPLRSKASRLSAEKAIEFLRELNYPSMYFSAIAHAIEAHSFSAAITPTTLEAKIVQDADRLDALGAIGIARCFITAGLMKRPLYSAVDPFCDERPIDDGQFTIDHFYKKLFLIAATLQTDSAKAEGQRRLQIMKRYLTDLSEEI